MADELPSMDISGVPDLVRLTADVRRTNEPRLLRRGSETLAIIVPAGSSNGDADESGRQPTWWPLRHPSAGGKMLTRRRSTQVLDTLVRREGCPLCDALES